MRCSNCNAVIPAGDAFCGECGTAADAPSPWAAPGPAAHGPTPWADSPGATSAPPGPAMGGGLKSSMGGRRTSQTRLPPGPHSPIVAPSTSGPPETAPSPPWSGDPSATTPTAGASSWPDGVLGHEPSPSGVPPYFPTDGIGTMGGATALPPPPPQAETKDQVGSLPARAILGCAVAGLILLGAVGYVVLGKDSTGGAQMLTSPSGRVLSSSARGPGKPPSTKPRWNEDVDCEAGCTLAADDRAIYVLSYTSSYTVGSASDDDYGEVEETISSRDEDDNTLTALDGSSGKELWSQDVTGSTLIGAIDGHILVYDSSEEEVASYDPQTGDREWRADGSWTQFRIGRDLVLSQYDADDSSASTSVISIDDGKTIWSEDGYPAGVCGGAAYLVDDDDVVARDARTGDERWTTRAEDGVDASCSRDGVFLAADGEVSSLDTGNGKERWTQKIKGASTVDAGDGAVVVGTDDEVLGLSPKDGEEQWSQDLADWGQVAGSIPAGKGRAIRSGEDGEELVLFDLKTGEEINSYRVPDASTALSPDRIYVLDEGEVAALTLGSLDEAWSFDGDKDATQIAVGGGRSYLLSETEISAHW